MIELKPIRQDAWDRILEERIPEYASEQIQAGRWTKSNALEEATKEFRSLLPDGVETPKHHVLGVHDLEADTLVGYLWYMERDKAGIPYIFICDIQVFDAFRRQGIASAVLQELDGIAEREHGVKRIELHVFGSNAVARALYLSAGFEETNVLMAKRLS